MCEHVFVAIEWTEEDCRPSIKQTIEGFFFFMHSKVEDQVSGTWSWTLFHSHHFILVSSEKSRRGHSCWLHPEPFLFRTSLPTGLHESQRGVWESAPPCPLSKMPHSYFHSLHNNWLHGVLSRKSFLVSGAGSSQETRRDSTRSGEITKLRYKKNKTVKSCCFNDNFSNFSKGGSCNCITISKGLICGSRII